MPGLKDDYRRIQAYAEDLQTRTDQLREDRESLARKMLERVIAFDEEDFPYRLDLLYQPGEHDARWDVGELRRCWQRARDMYEYDLEFSDADWDIGLSGDGENYEISSLLHYSHGETERHEIRVPSWLLDWDEIDAREHVGRLVDEARRCEYEENMRQERKRVEREREMFAVLAAKYGK